MSYKAHASVSDVRCFQILQLQMAKFVHRTIWSESIGVKWSACMPNILNINIPKMCIQGNWLQTHRMFTMNRHRGYFVEWKESSRNIFCSYHSMAIRSAKGVPKTHSLLPNNFYTLLSIKLAWNPNFVMLSISFEQIKSPARECTQTRRQCASIRFSIQRDGFGVRREQWKNDDEEMGGNIVAMPRTLQRNEVRRGRRWRSMRRRMWWSEKCSINWVAINELCQSLCGVCVVPLVAYIS